ncbi:MAG TPA: hypothetical protein VII83_04895 [Gaiellaceae bacterium]
MSDLPGVVVLPEHSANSAEQCAWEPPLARAAAERPTDAQERVVRE